MFHGDNKQLRLNCKIVIIIYISASEVIILIYQRHIIIWHPHLLERILHIVHHMMKITVTNHHFTPNQIISHITYAGNLNDTS